MNIPCREYLAYSCEKMVELCVLESFLTGKEVACEIAKVKEIGIDKETPDGASI
jgi:hypothetical protein